MAGEELYTYAVILLGMGGIIFILMKMVSEKNNPYAFEQYFNKDIIKIRMYEVEPASYDENVSKPIFDFKQFGLYGKLGLYFAGYNYPIARAMLTRMGNKEYALFYRSGGKKGIMPVMPLDIKNNKKLSEEDKIKEMELKKIDPVNPKLIYADYISDSNLAFLVPAKTQMEMMNDNYIDNFMTRQQSIATQVLDQLDVLTKAILPIGTVLIFSLVIVSATLVFVSDIIAKSSASASNILPSSINSAISALVSNGLCESPPSSSSSQPVSSQNSSSKNDMFGIIPVG